MSSGRQTLADRVNYESPLERALDRAEMYHERIMAMENDGVMLRNVRAENLRLGDLVLSPDIGSANTVNIMSVHTLQLAGDDVTVNEVFTTSQDNLVTILVR